MGMAMPSSDVMSVGYDARIVVLSFVIACAAAYVALCLGERVTESRGRARYCWLLGGATAMGTGIWSMHFTGMLAFHLPVPVSYDVPTVVASYAAAILASGVALAAVSRRSLSVGPWLAGGLSMGIAITAMHYVGMAAMRLSAAAYWNPQIVALSAVIAIDASLAAIWLVFKFRSVPSGALPARLAATLVMGGAIAGMHYTGMAAATFVASRTYAPAGLVVSAGALGGGAIALGTLLVLAFVIVFAYVDRRFSVQEQALQESRHHVHMVIANAPVILFALDVDGIITMAEGRGLATIVDTPDSVLGRSFFDAYAALTTWTEQARRALAGEEHTALCTTGDIVIEMRWTPMHNDVGSITGVIAVGTDITKRRQAEVALQHQSHHDALTGLPNWKFLHERLNESVHAARAAGSLGLALIDLNRFKEVNDRLGHQTGDLFLAKVAERIKGAVREDDFVARIGGDEFAVVFRDATESNCEALARRLVSAFAAPCLIGGQALPMSGSIGIALYPGHGTDAMMLLRHADVAMYVAKRGKLDYTVYDEMQDRHNNARLALENDLAKAVAHNELVLHYQPKIHVPTNSLQQVEALVRWEHPTLGLLPPDQFIPLAEQSSLIGQITRYVLETALQQVQTWSNDGKPLRVAVNLSMQTLDDRLLPEMVAQLLAQYEIAPELLTLEITETALERNPEQTAAVLRRLADLRVRLSIDDFGTGYSSLNRLKNLPFSEIKIDKSFILGMASDWKDAAIVRFINGLGQTLNLRVVAEGVETMEAWDALVALQCDTVQGYYLSRPLPIDEFDRWIASSQWGKGHDRGREGSPHEPRRTERLRRPVKSIEAA